jgi:hypothetical protein
MAITRSLDPNDWSAVGSGRVPGAAAPSAEAEAAGISRQKRRRENDEGPSNIPATDSHYEPASAPLASLGAVAGGHPLVWPLWAARKPREA